MWLFECSDCKREIEDKDFKVRFPNIPNLLERLSPGEPVPYGECPDCGALVHEAQAIPGKRAFLTIVDGKFQVTCPFVPNREPDLTTDDPEEVRTFLRQARVESVSCSSSVDFPEEYGMDPKKVAQLLGEDDE